MAPGEIMVPSAIRAFPMFNCLYPLPHPCDATGRRIRSAHAHLRNLLKKSKQPTFAASCALYANRLLSDSCAYLLSAYPSPGPLLHNFVIAQAIAFSLGQEPLTVTKTLFERAQESLNAHADSFAEYFEKHNLTPSRSVAGAFLSRGEPEETPKAHGNPHWVNLPGCCHPRL